MAKNFTCPIPGQEQLFNQLLDKLGERQLWKLWKRYNNLNQIQKLVSPAPSNLSETVEAINKISKTITLVETLPEADNDEPVHKYKDGEGNLYDSVSDVLNRFGPTRYNNEDPGKKYADRGTMIHRIWEELITGKSVPEILADKQYASIPYEYTKRVAAFIDNLKKTGRVLSEVKVYDIPKKGERGIAGSIDIVHIKNDGTIDIYDIKTSHQTESKQKGIWNPTKDYDGYKARRYSTQVKLYGEMLFRQTGRPVSNYYLVPTEVFYENGDSNQPISDIRLVGYIKSTDELGNVFNRQNIEELGYERGAERWIDSIFGTELENVVPFSLETPDVSQNVIGRIAGKSVDQIGFSFTEGQAAEAYLKTHLAKNGQGYLDRGGNYQKFYSQDRSMQISQVINEVIAPERESRRDLVSSILNYMDTGDDPFMSEHLKSALSLYKGQDYEVYNLNTIKGFENLKGWTVLQQRDPQNQVKNVHLLYTGRDSFDSAVHQTKPIDDNLFAIDNANHLIGKHLKNKVRDLKQIEAFVIAAQLLKSSPDIKIGAMYLYSETSRSLPYLINPRYLLKTLNNLKEYAPKDLVSTELSALLDDSITEDSFTDDYSVRLMSYLQSVDVTGSTALEANLADFLDKRQLSKDLIADLEDLLLEYGPKKDEESRNLRVLISQALFQMKQVSTWDQPVRNFLQKSRFLNISEVDGNIVQHLNKELQNANIRMQDQFFNKYKKESEKVIEKFLKDSGMNIVLQYTISDATKYFEPLFQRETKKVRGENQVVNSYKLKREGSEDFEKLQPFQKEFIRWYSSKLSQAASNAGLKWDPANIPLVRGSLSNTFYKVGTGEASRSELFRRLGDRLKDNFEIKETEGSSPIEETSLYNLANWFSRQNVDTDRLELLRANNFEVQNPEEYFGFETNLEIALDMFMFNAIRLKELDPLRRTALAARNVYEFYSTGVNAEFEVNKKIIDDMTTIILQNKDLDSGSTVNKIATVTSNMVRMGWLGGNLKSGAVVGLGQLMRTYAIGLAGTLQANGIPVDISSVNKAWKYFTTPSLQKLTFEIMDLYGYHEHDPTVFNTSVHKATRKSIFSNKWMFWAMRQGDKYSKALFVIASMVKDGSIKAYSLDTEGNLVYDESKDLRFKGEKGKALRESVRLNLEENGIGLNPDGTLSRGYDLDEQAYLKKHMDRAFGAMDRTSRSPLSFFGFMKFFMLFKHYVPGIVARMANTRIQDLQLGKKVYYKNPDGSYTAKWEASEREGVARSFFNIIARAYYFAQRKPTKPLSEEEKSNLRLLGAELTFIALGMAAASALAGDGEDKEGIYWARIMRGATQDLLLGYNLSGDNIDFMLRPLAIDFFYTFAKSASKAAQGLGEGETDQLIELMNFPGFMRQFDLPQ